MAFCRIDKVGIGSVQSTFEHAHSIAWSVPHVSSEVYAPLVRNKDFRTLFRFACAEVEEAFVSVHPGGVYI